MDSKQLQDQLEQLLDKTSIYEMVFALSCVCNDKAEHVESNWQDATLAKAWSKNSALLNALAGKLHKTF